MKIVDQLATSPLAKTPIEVSKQFDRNARLWGSNAAKCLENSHVMVLGLGGVGSFAAEALARAGIGRLTLVDFDEVCITNLNRQLHAMTNTIGSSKAQLMAERIRLINPKAQVKHIHSFYEASTSNEILSGNPDLILDCIDNVTAKLHLIATCIFRQIPIVICLGASGKLDPTKIKFSELRKTQNDPLAKAIRRSLWKNYRINLKRVSNLIGVYSDEDVILPDPGYKSSLCGTECLCPNSSNQHHTCAKRNIIWGSAVFVTSVFGMVAASLATRFLVNDQTIKLTPELKFLPGDDQPLDPTQELPTSESFNPEDQKSISTHCRQTTNQKASYNYKQSA